MLPAFVLRGITVVSLTCTVENIINFFALQRNNVLAKWKIRLQWKRTI